MRLLVVGRLNGQLSLAVKMAMQAGAKVSHVETYIHDKETIEGIGQ